MESYIVDTLNNADSRLIKDVFLYRLRKNNVLIWVKRLEAVNKYKEILRNCNPLSTLTVESGIVKVEPAGIYISHEFVPLVDAGFHFAEIATILKSKIVLFEKEYTEVSLTQGELDKLKNVIYKYNKSISGPFDITDKKRLIHLEQSATVLSHLLTNSIKFKNQINGWCSLTFANSNNETIDYCTIFTEEEIALLEKVNNCIQH